MQSIVIEILKSVWTMEWGKRLAGVWLVSFVAASGGILARRFHHDRGPPQADARQRLRERNTWNRRPKP
jgi:hypothetical protein